MPEMARVSTRKIHASSVQGCRDFASWVESDADAHLEAAAPCQQLEQALDQPCCALLRLGHAAAASTGRQCKTLHDKQHKAAADGVFKTRNVITYQMFSRPSR